MISSRFFLREYQRFDLTEHGGGHPKAPRGRIIIIRVITIVGPITRWISRQRRIGGLAIIGKLLAIYVLRLRPRVELSDSTLAPSY